jgi:hypothetical protein
LEGWSFTIKLCPQTGENAAMELADRKPFFEEGVPELQEFRSCRMRDIGTLAKNSLGDEELQNRWP